jgi:hypothetical protein
MNDPMNDHKFRRRTLIQVGGALAGAAALGVPARRGLAAGKTEAKTIKIGFVSPQTGPLAVIVDNSVAPNIPTGGKLKPLA